MHAEGKKQDFYTYKVVKWPKHAYLCATSENRAGEKHSSAIPRR